MSSVVMGIPKHLPKRLSISFPIFGIYDTPPGGAYHNWDKCMREHVERGFNCIRLDDGAGLMHDENGIPRGPTNIISPFPGHGKTIRQLDCTGNGGGCDLLARLVELFEAAASHNVYIILSSWYYLHTFWYCGDNELNESLHRIQPHERFMYFAKALDFIICELKSRNLADRIAFAEIFNEADGLNFINGYGASNQLGKDERNRFRDEHAAAIGYLRSKHPDILFAYDTYTPFTDVEQMPDNLQVWNFHSYFMWDIYALVESRLLQEGTDVTDPAELGILKDFMNAHPVPLAEIQKSREGKLPAMADWYRRIWLYRNLDPAKMPALEKLFEHKLDDEFDNYKQKICEMLECVKKVSEERCPGAPLVMGEGVSYCGSKNLLWEEHSEKYWELLEFAVQNYKKAGLWGCVLRTCCGPEDPVWNLAPEKLVRLNKLFQGS